MNREYVRESIPQDVQDQILRDHFRFRSLKTKFHLGATDVTQREATVREYIVLSELTTAGEGPYSITSQKPLIGPIIVWAKRILLALVTPIIRQAFQRQTVLNQHLVAQYQSVRELEIRVQRLERDLKRLRQSESHR